MFRTVLIVTLLGGCSQAPSPAAPAAAPVTGPPGAGATTEPASTTPVTPPPAVWQCGLRRVVASAQEGAALLDLKLWCEDGAQVRDDSRSVHKPVSNADFDAAWKRINESTDWKTMKHDCGQSEGQVSFAIELSDGSTTRRFECSDIAAPPANLAPLLDALKKVDEDLTK